MADPEKQATGRPMAEDPWGVGQLDDGKIEAMTEEQARLKMIERDAEEQAFGEDDDFEEDLDDVSDLDDDDER